MKLTPIRASRFEADGGAMFGLVPRTLWQKLVEPNAQNLIPQTLNTWLIETDDGRFGLLDLGCGNPLWKTEKARRISGMPDTWDLEDGLAARGIAHDQIDFVILSHLHWDHAGGVGHRHEDGTTEITFPNAVHIVHADEYALAGSGDPLLFKAYPGDVIAPLQALGRERLRLVEGDVNEVLPGIQMLRSGGHTAGHCIVVFAPGSCEINCPGAFAPADGARTVYAADMVPTQHHLRLVYQMAYDTYPLDVRRWKREWLPDMARRGDLLLFDHDPELIGATLQPHETREFITAETLLPPPAA